MFASRKELLNLYCLTFLTHLSPVISVRQISAKFKMVQPALASPQYGDRIRCAYRAMHHSYAAIRLAEESGICERLTDEEMDLGMEAGFEYFQKYSAIQKLQPRLVACKPSEREIKFYPYTTVKVGDLFELVLQKCGNDRFTINFKSNDGSIVLHLSTRDGSVPLNTATTGVWGEGETCSPPDPFASYKEYMIRFEIFDAYWKICIDQKVCCQFGHRLPFSAVTEVQAILTGPNVTLVSVKVTTAVP